MYITRILFSTLILAAFLVFPGYVTIQTFKSFYRLYIKKDRSQFIWDIQKLVIAILSTLHILIFGLFYLFTTASSEDSILIFLFSFWVFPVVILLPYYLSVSLHYYLNVNRKRKTIALADLKLIKIEYEKLSRFILCSFISLSVINILINAILFFKGFTDAID